MADRFFCPDPPSADGRVSLHGDEARHLARVRRVGLGEVVELFDGRGSGYRAEVVELAKDRVELRAIEAPRRGPEPPCEVCLATAVPKGERFDWLVEKATELGVTRMVPIVTERSSVDPRPHKLDRLRRLVVEASKQCGRFRLMELEPTRPWAEVVPEATGGIGLLAHPGGRSARSWPIAEQGSPIWVAIGPEGGFTEAEVALARSAGWVLVGLGPTLLRVETAGLAACARVLGLAERIEEQGKEAAE